MSSDQLQATLAQQPETATEYDLTVVVPAFNEQGGISDTLKQIDDALSKTPCSSQVVVVDDGSTDETAKMAEACGASVIRQVENRGYGAALKAGIVASQSKYVAIIDADGTYPADKIPEMFERAESADMVVGSRAASSANIPLVRRPAKWMLGKLASYLAGRHIPDLNSGLRVIRRSALEQFIPLLPSKFSFTTTITLCMMCTEHVVTYIPIEYRARVGRSKIRPVDFFNFIVLVLRTIVMFNPLRVFLPLGFMLFVAGAAKFIYDIFRNDLSESAVTAVLAAIMVWSLGLLADMISRQNLLYRNHITRS